MRHLRRALVAATLLHWQSCASGPQASGPQASGPQASGPQASGPLEETTNALLLRHVRAAWSEERTAHLRDCSAVEYAGAHLLFLEPFLWKHPSALQAFYGKDFKPAFSGKGKLLKETTLLLEMMERPQALPFVPQRTRQAEQALREQASPNGQLDPLPDPLLLKLVRHWRRRLPSTAPTSLLSHLAVRDLLFNAQHWPFAAKPTQRVCDARRAEARALARLELTFADDLLSYADALRLGHPQLYAFSAKHRWAAQGRPATSFDEQKWQQTWAATRTERELEVLQLGRDTPRKLSHFLRPPHPYYQPLLQAYRKYHAIVESGGWQSVSSSVPVERAKRRSDAYPLAQRLAKEGYLKEGSGPAPQEDLAHAIKRFQKAHQQNDTGRPNPRFWKELNVAAETRMEAIARTLETLRESRVGADFPQVLVNIPDLHLEFWGRDRRLLRTRVVVGEPRAKRCDEESRRFVHAHATPELSASLRSIIFSPFWNVPRTIQERELETEFLKDPTLFEGEGYELVEEQNERLRQLPGPQNALGFVKFVIPNPHGIYLHDTPSKHLFRSNRRARSHGCIRVQRPLRLAELALDGGAQWNAEAVGELHRDWQRSPAGLAGADPASLRQEVALRAPVPVHLEYYLTRINDNGDVEFLSDIYGREKAPRSGPCIPDSVRARQAFGAVTTQLEHVMKKYESARSCFSASTRGNRISESGFINLLSAVYRLRGEIRMELSENGNRWNDTQMQKAVRLSRSLSELKKMLRQAERQCASRPGAS